MINSDEAETTRFIFQRYLELGSVSRLRAELEAKGIRTKSWVSTRGKRMGGAAWYIGPLRHILRNRVYVGDAMHKGTAHPGEHGAIISRDLFDAVQAKLDANRTSHHRKKTIGSDALLTGLIFDDRGNVMSPTKSRRPGGRYYLYYVSQARIQRRDPDAMRPIPASAIEEIVQDRLDCIINIPRSTCGGESKTASGEPAESSLRERIRELILRVDVSDSRVVITFSGKALAVQTENTLKQLSTALRTKLPSKDNWETDGDNIVLTVPVRLRLRGGIKRVEGWDQSNWTTANPRHDLALIKALAQAHEWRGWVEAGDVVTLEDVAARVSHDRKHTRQILKLAFLAPDIQRDIMTGRQHKSLTLAALIEADLPLLWTEQRTWLGIATQG